MINAEQKNGANEVIIDMPNQIAAIAKKSTPSKSEEDEVSAWVRETSNNTCKMDGVTVDNGCREKTEAFLISMVKDLKK